MAKQNLTHTDRMAIELHTLAGHSFEGMKSCLGENGFRT
jgi:hypothetical protein